MAYFPDSIMPKRLRKETAKEVDNSPLIYNARDYNIHHREIRSIQQLLIGVTGQGSNSSVAAGTNTSRSTTGSGSESGGTSVASVLVRYIEILEMFLNRGYMGHYAGTVQAGGQIQLPPNLISTQTVGTVNVGDATINVSSTAGFPPSGTITKFNRLDVIELCTDGNPPGGGSRCNPGSQKIIGYAGLIPSGYHATNQEIITYTGVTATSFTGCTRSVNGSTAQQATNEYPAIILSGRAAMSLSHNMWGRGTSGTPNQFWLAHDAMLKTSAAVQAEGSRTRLGGELQDHIEIGWMLSVVGDFSDIDIRQLFSIAE